MPTTPLSPNQIAAGIAEMSAKFTETGGDPYVLATGEKREPIE